MGDYHAEDDLAASAEWWEGLSWSVSRRIRKLLHDGMSRTAQPQGFGVWGVHVLANEELQRVWGRGAPKV
jgi:hypothetical protein